MQFLKFLILECDSPHFIRIILHSLCTFIMQALGVIQTLLGASIGLLIYIVQCLFERGGLESILRNLFVLKNSKDFVKVCLTTKCNYCTFQFLPILKNDFLVYCLRSWTFYCKKEYPKGEIKFFFYFKFSILRLWKQYLGNLLPMQSLLCYFSSSLRKAKSMCNFSS